MIEILYTIQMRLILVNVSVSALSESAQMSMILPAIFLYCLLMFFKKLKVPKKLYVIHIIVTVENPTHRKHFL